VGIDVLGPLLQTEQGKKYILVSMDQLRKRPEVYALPNHGAGTVADVLVYQFSSRFGVPAEIHSDQGQKLEFFRSQRISNPLPKPDDTV